VDVQITKLLQFSFVNFHVGWGGGGGLRWTLLDY